MVTRKSSSTAKATTRSPASKAASAKSAPKAAPKAGGTKARTGAAAKAELAEALVAPLEDENDTPSVAPKDVAAVVLGANEPVVNAVSPRIEDITEFTKRDLMARLRDHEALKGVPGRAVRGVLDVVLEELGEALSRGDTLRLPPLGVGRVQKARRENGNETIVLRIKRKNRDTNGKDPLADAAE